MVLNHFLEEEDDEGDSLLRGPETRGRRFSDLVAKVEAAPRSFNELTWQAKLAAAVAVLTVIWFWRSANGGPAPVGLKLRGLESGDELKWAEDTFGVFLKVAVPFLQKANHDVHHFLNMLPQGQCKEWAELFAEKGTFSFNLPHLHGEFTSRAEVRDAFCQDTAASIRAIRLVWNFPDAERLAGTALYEVFTQGAPGSAVEKARWAQFARLRKPKGGEVAQIEEFRLYVEAPGDGQLKDVVDDVVKANLQRLNGHDCAGFTGALPSTGTETWQLQSLPTGPGKKDELLEQPREQILAKCKRDTTGDWKNIDLQHASLAGVFPSSRDKEVLLYFHKEKRYKSTIDVTDDPEALLIKLDAEVPPKVHALYLFFLEGVHIVEEWGWRYGAAIPP